MKRDNGFTLVELIIVMTVVSVLLAAAVPSFKEFVKNNRVSGEAAKLIIALQVARSEAITRGAAIVICASTDQATCSGSNDWSTGWITFTDFDQDAALDGTGSCTSEADRLTRDCILRVNTALDRVELDAGDNLLQFLPGGQADNAPVTFTLRAENCERKQQRAISVTGQGHVSSDQQACS